MFGRKNFTDVVKVMIIMDKFVRKDFCFRKYELDFRSNPDF